MRISDWSSDVCSSDLVLLRDLARSGRLARLRLRLQDRPGALFQIARIFDEQQVNIIEIYHQRVFTTLPAKGLITDIECETRDRAHLDRLRSEEHTSELQSLMRISYAVFCLKKKNTNTKT